MTNQEKDHVVAAAIEKDGRIWTLPPPARHHNIISEIHSEIGKQVTRDYKQGFIDQNGRFLSRWEARRIAICAGQIIDTNWGDELYSEDLW